MCEETAKPAVVKHHRVGTMFIDSGGHSLFTKLVLAKRSVRGKRDRSVRLVDDYSAYKTKEFWEYVDTYAGWVKENEKALDFYVNVDVIFQPEMSWTVQRYLEDEHGLKPVPVIHYGTDYKWIDRYIESGHDFVGLGGLGQEVNKGAYFKWADGVYTRLGAGNNGIPCVRTHGFAMTSWELLSRYPWWSVDSASWVKAAGFGHIYVPRKNKGKFCFSVPPFGIAVSSKSKKLQGTARHAKKLIGCDKQHILDWLDLLGISYGETDSEGTTIVEGVENSHKARCMVNLEFYQRFAATIPEWPWAFHRRGFSGFGL